MCTISCNVKLICDSYGKPFASKKNEDRENVFPVEKMKAYEAPSLELIPIDSDVVTASSATDTDWETDEFSLGNIW